MKSKHRRDFILCPRIDASSYLITNFNSVTEDQQTMLKAVQYANYLHQQSLQETEGVDAAELLKLSKGSKFNSEDELMRYSSSAELEDHKKAFESVLVTLGLTWSNIKATILLD